MAQALVEQFVELSGRQLTALLTEALSDEPQFGVDRLAIAHINQSAGVAALLQVVTSAGMRRGAAGGSPRQCHSRTRRPHLPSSGSTGMKYVV